MLPKSTTALLLLLTLGTLGLILPGAGPVYGAPEDVALFQEVLSRYGQWLNHGQYGQVWRPSQVDRQWRPYTNGRWVPSQEGYVFETDEPWGWATYHYGNWLSTREHGWIWVPGRTWYPHTVNWRSNDDNVGWAPVPPPEYAGGDNYSSGGYADSYGSSPSLGGYGGGAYGLAPSAWIFTRASDFLLGWDRPYSSAYSYANSGVLLGPQYSPVIYERTVFINNFVTPSYAPRACYNWGPPVTYITKVTNINHVDFERRCREPRMGRLRNVLPPAQIAHRHPAWRDLMPAATETRQRHIRSAGHTPPGRLNRPDAIPAPTSLSRPPAREEAHGGAGGPRPFGPPTVTEPVSGRPQPPGRDHGRLDPSQNRQTPGPAVRSPQTANSPLAGTVPAIPGATASNRPGEAARQEVPAPPYPRQIQSHRRPQPGETPSAHETRPGRSQDPRLRPDHQVPEPELRMRQQQRQEMERQRQVRSGPPSQAPDLQQQRQTEVLRQQQQRQEMERRQQAQQHQQMQMEQHRRQAEMQQRQQLEHQRRQAEMQQRQQMENQRRQAEMQQRQQMENQRRQAEMLRAQQAQQQQAARQAPPPQSQDHGGRKKRPDNQ